MKTRYIFTLGLSIAIFCTNHLSVLAQNRQPTNTDLRKLQKDLQEHVSSLKNNSSIAHYIQDSRTQAEKNKRESLVSRWSKIEPKLAPFLGDWSGYEAGISIYPSNTRGRVCVASTNIAYGSVTTGIFTNGAIQTSRGEILFKNGNYLGSALLKKGRFERNYETPFKSPRALEPINKGISGMFDASEKQKTMLIRSLRKYGCRS